MVFLQLFRKTCLSGRGRSGKVYHYKHTMEMVNDDKVIEAIVAMLMDLQERENIDLPLYEQQLRDVEWVPIEDIKSKTEAGNRMASVFCWIMVCC